MKIAFITEGSTNTGYGHLYRSIALAQEFISYNCAVDFFCDGEIPNRIICDNLPKINVFEESDFKKIINNYNLTIIDVYKNSWSDYKWLTQLSDLKTASIIDYAFKEYSIPTDFVFQIGFQEYRFKETKHHNENGKILKVYSGNDFFIFREEFKKGCSFEVIKDANKILVSMGGSDPYKLSELVSESLVNIKKPLKIQLILGAGISNSRLHQIKLIFVNTVHDVSVSQDVSSIAKLMKNNDIAIINGGNTRFELTVIGVPFISISFNETQNDIGNYLEEHGIGKNIGVYSDIDKETIENTTNELLNNFDARRFMSEKLKKSISLKGTENILNILYPQR